MNQAGNVAGNYARAANTPAVDYNTAAGPSRRRLIGQNKRDDSFAYSRKPNPRHARAAAGALRGM